MLKRLRGSPFIYAKVGERNTLTVPVHGNTPLKPGLATKLAKAADVRW